MSLTSVFHSENLISMSQRVEIKYQHKPEVSPMEQNCTKIVSSRLIYSIRNLKIKKKIYIKFNIY